MTDDFILEVNYLGVDQQYTGNLLLQGYTHKIRVLINETEVFFEPDEEGRYRVVKMPWQDEKQLTKIDKALIGIIRQKIESILA
jgi:hypothetical protein